MRWFGRKNKPLPPVEEVFRLEEGMKLPELKEETLPPMTPPPTGIPVDNPREDAHKKHLEAVVAHLEMMAKRL